MNIATVIGVLSGFFILSYATYASTADIRVFFNLPGLAIVLGGTIAATFICYPLKRVAGVFGVFVLALKREELPIGEYISELVSLAKTARAKGKIQLERALEGIENQFLHHSIQMLVDGYSREEIKEILDARIQNTYEQETGQAEIFRTMAKLMPAFGIIGTLIGLISMMQSLEGNLQGLGPAMATALTTTFYGILFSQMIFFPLAVKVEQRIEERVALMCVIRDGILFIQDKTPPAIVLDKLRAYLPPGRWGSIKRKASS
ncbi:MAG: MotA/TolQ/ExbB proton channel family protein [Pseudomonadota bacterium]